MSSELAEKRTETKKVNRIRKCKTKGLKDFVTISIYGTGYRLRWKKKSLERSGKLAVDQSEKTFPKQTLAEEYAQYQLDKCHSLTTAEREFTDQKRNSLLGQALKIERAGYDPEEAMRIGLEQMQKRGQYADLQLNHFLEGFIKSKETSWNYKHMINFKYYTKFAAEFFKTELGKFTDRIKATKIVKNHFAEFNKPRTIEVKTFGNSHSRGTKGWASKSTCNRYRTYLKAFFEYIRSQEKGRIIKNDDIIDFLNKKEIYPPNLKKGRPNNSPTPEQAAMLIDCFANCAHRTNPRGMPSKTGAGYIVFKLFMGARSELVHKWKWRIWDKANNQIIIPSHETKNKSLQKFSIDWIPNFDVWLNWAWMKDGCPAENQPICKTAKQGDEKILAKFMNQHREIFAVEDPDTGRVDKRKKITPAESHHNYMRNGFMTYAENLADHKEPQNLGFTKPRVEKIGEDKCSRHWYHDDQKQAEHEMARKYFSMKPDDYRYLLPKSYLDKIA